ncbi:hypothetical protein [Mesorhizobium sp. ANAO-SY3R2]|uniref:hypothetical protein n=1 Tax=Mesorhizobium sp. ANAO-SY3R2 TaxID=3166644 RepID=UPI00366E6DFC
MPFAWLLAIAALVEAVTGIALIAIPDAVVQLLLGQGLTGTGLAVGRLTGIALLALGIGAWVGRLEDGRTATSAAMLVYNVLAAIYLLYLGLDGALVGKLLWPAVAIHAVLGLLFVRAWFSQRPRQ